MTDERDRSLAPFTTLGVGGPARRLVEAATTDDLVAAIREADAAAEPLLVLGAGSNVVVPDAGFPGTVVRVATSQVRVDDDSSCGGVSVTVDAGYPWDDLVARCVGEGWVGVEALSGIPGTTGATPVQNVGAYGQEVAATIARVRTFDRRAGEVRSFAASDCAFGYRTSRFRRDPRYVVLDVTFQLPHGDLSAPVAYAELAATVGIAVGERVPLADVREAVLRLRRGKGMVLDPADPDTRSVGSFFVNPVVPSTVADTLPAAAPRWPNVDGSVKLSAAWLIERAGVAKGSGGERARVSSKHCLALTNPGDATAADVLRLAESIRDAVAAAFGVSLEPEPVILDPDSSWAARAYLVPFTRGAEQP